MVHLGLTEDPAPTAPQGHQAHPVLQWGPTTRDPTTRGPPVHSEYSLLLGLLLIPAISS